MQLGQGKPDRTFAAPVQIIGTVHLVAHVVGNVGIEHSFEIRQLVVGCVGAALGEQRSAVKLKQLFLDHATHHVGYIHLVRAFTELAVKTIPIKQGQPDLEVCFFAVMRCGGHQQEVPGDAA